ncbi:MAG: hypothetical protein M1536_02500 [Firmicutes bacterium]|nr:hypothetical protein [Bacillota bacterium]
MMSIIANIPGIINNGNMADNISHPENIIGISNRHLALDGNFCLVDFCSLPGFIASKNNVMPTGNVINNKIGMAGARKPRKKAVPR